MRNRWVKLAVVVCVFALSMPLAVPVILADDTAQAESSATPQKAQKPKMVCKKEASTGSAIKRRTCRSQRQVDADRENAKENMSRVNDGQSGRAPPGAG